MAKTKKLTSSVLRKLVLEEKAKIEKVMNGSGVDEEII